MALFDWYMRRVSFGATRLFFVLILGFLWRWMGLHWAMWTVFATEFVMTGCLCIGFAKLNSAEWKLFGKLKTMVLIVHGYISVLVWINFAYEGHPLLATILAVTTMILVTIFSKGVQK